MPESLTSHGEAPEISVVVPLYNEQENVAELHRRLGLALGSLGVPYEIVFVDDGSRDATPRLIDELQGADPDLAAAILAGLGPSVSTTADVTPTGGGDLDVDVTLSAEAVALVEAARQGAGFFALWFGRSFAYRSVYAIGAVLEVRTRPSPSCRRWLCWGSGRRWARGSRGDGGYPSPLTTGPLGDWAALGTAPCHGRAVPMRRLRGDQLEADPETGDQVLQRQGHGRAVDQKKGRTRSSGPGCRAAGSRTTRCGGNNSPWPTPWGSS
jgi:hypothetical protein